MNGFPRFVSKKMARIISEKWLFRREAPPFLPFYHVVSNEKLPHILNYPYRSVKQFEKELDFFLKYFEPVSLKELFPAPKRTRKIFHLTFDDGLKECAEIVAPLLLRKGIPATFFVNTNFVDNRQLFHKYKASLIYTEMLRKFHVKANNLLKNEGLTGKNILRAEQSQTELLNEVATLMQIDFQEFLKERQPYLTTEQIRQLQADGFSIGAHSADHPEFYRIDEKKQTEQIKSSVQWVTDNIQPEIRAFSFPFTDHGVSSSVLKKIKEKNICDITFGTAGLKYDQFDFHFQRYPAEQHGNHTGNLKGEFVYYELRKLIGKERVEHE